LDALVPNLMLQPLIENAIQHGIAPHSSAGRIEIRAERRDGTIVLQVRDDGPGLQSGEEPLHEGIGLANTRSRLQQLYGSEHHFEIGNSNGGGGLLVKLAIPYRQARREDLGSKG